VVPVYIHDEAGDGRWRAGEASQWWLRHSLASLDASLRERGSRLVLARGDSRRELARMVRASGAGAVYWNRRYEPGALGLEGLVGADLARAGVEARCFNGALLFEPWAVANRKGGPFQVFAPYWRRCLELGAEAPRPLRAGAFAKPAAWPRSVPLEKLGLVPAAGRFDGLARAWQPGEKGSAARLRRFVSGALGSYAEARDRPGVDATSMLSPWLHFGEIGPRQVWQALKAISWESGVFPPSNSAGVFLRELGWREFAYHLLYHFPRTPESPLRPEFARFPWARDPGGRNLSAWQGGLTGYPIVDAGMRQLRLTGWMHNRVRMIAASFLVKHLRLPWNEGAKWFWNTLVDADLANNTLGWQWSAGCGADAAPYFRIFSPVRQGQRFDPSGDYVGRWVPELARMPPRFIHSPWEAPEPVLRRAGVRLGDTYPHPIVDHRAAWAAALAAFRRLRINHIA
jgi:deoxyribodipyrimidine photo-lyase